MDEISDKKIALEVIKIVLLGDNYAEKSSICYSFLGRVFNDVKTPTNTYDKLETIFTLKNEKKN